MGKERREGEEGGKKKGTGLYLYLDYSGGEREREREMVG